MSGYRRPSLAMELAGARTALQAAGIENEVEPAPEGLPPDVDAMLGWAVREGVTNVLRHSDASRASIRVVADGDSRAVEVVDDGTTDIDTEAPGHARATGLRVGRPPRAGRFARRAGRGRAAARPRVPPAGQRAASGRGRRMTRILLAEDQALVRGALAALLELEHDLEVVAQVVVATRSCPGAADEARRRAPRHRDARAGRAGRRGAAPGGAARVPGRDPHHVRAAGLPAPRDGGRRDRVPAEGRARERPRRAVRRVALGQRVVDPALALDALSEGPNPLSAREREALALATTTGTVADIATQLGLSEGTVRNHLSAAIQKVGARNRSEAARIAAAKGWLAPDVDG